MTAHCFIAPSVCVCSSPIKFVKSQWTGVPLCNISRSRKWSLSSSNEKKTSEKLVVPQEAAAALKLNVHQVGTAPREHELQGSFGVCSPLFDCCPQLPASLACLPTTGMFASLWLPVGSARGPLTLCLNINKVLKSGSYSKYTGEHKVLFSLLYLACSLGTVSHRKWVV